MLRTTEIATPLGRVLFSASIICDEDAQISIKEGKIVPTLPDKMVVSECHGVLLQVSSSLEMEGLLFEALLQADRVDQGLENGESLEARSFASSDWLVMIGTEDTDRLNSRLGENARGCEANQSSGQLLISADKLSSGFTHTFHYVVAWNQRPELLEDACWFAVDIDHERLLRALS